MEISHMMPPGQALKIARQETGAGCRPGIVTACEKTAGGCMIIHSRPPTKPSYKGLGFRCGDKGGIQIMWATTAKE